MKTKRGLLSTSRATERHRTITQTLAIDEFGELAGRKRDAAAIARQHGHQLTPWRKRKNDPYGRQDAWCVDCGRIVTVCVEKPVDVPLAYGKALTEECQHG